MGTPFISVAVLAALVEAGHEIVAVYSQPPRKAGRGMELQKSPVQKFAEAQGIEVRTPVSLKSKDEQQAFADLTLDVAIVVAYGLLLPGPILDAPRLGCLNMHASLLPRWRGAAPIQRAIMAGDAQSGVMIMQMDEGLDTGAVLSGVRVPITSETTADSLHDQLAAVGAPLMVQTMEALAEGGLTAQAQPDEGITYAKKIDKAEAMIDWSRPAVELDRHIRGLSPFPGAYFEMERKGKKERVKILRATPVSGDGAPGTLLDEAFTIACGDGALRLLEVQRAGKARVLAADFLRGLSLTVGKSLAQ